MELITKCDVVTQAVNECIDRLYAKAQPSIPVGGLKDAVAAFKKEPKEMQTKYPFYSRYYIPNDLYNEICEMYMSAYKIVNPFKDHMDTAIEYLRDGGTKDKWVEGYVDKDGFKTPGYRGYEKVPSIGKQIEEILVNYNFKMGNKFNKDFCDLRDDLIKAVLDSLTECKNFYNPNRDEIAFRFNVGDVSPTTNIESAREYWATKDPSVVIKEKKYDPDEDEWVFDEEKEP